MASRPEADIQRREDGILIDRGGLVAELLSPAGKMALLCFGLVLVLVQFGGFGAGAVIFALAGGASLLVLWRKGPPDEIDFSTTSAEVRVSRRGDVVESIGFADVRGFEIEWDQDEARRSDLGDGGRALQLTLRCASGREFILDTSTDRARLELLRDELDSLIARTLADSTLRR